MSLFTDHAHITPSLFLQRWGDAPVHSIAAALFLDKSQIHFFNDIGYEHNPYIHCPRGDAYERGKCACDQKRSFGASRSFTAMGIASCGEADGVYQITMVTRA